VGREIVIAGADVAGLTAAINLHRAGRAVRLIDRDAASGARRFPDWDAVENWTSVEDFPAFLERIGVDGAQFRHVGHRTFSLIDPYGRRYEIETPRPFFYLVKRGATAGGLERGLQMQAEAMGIPIPYRQPCPRGAADIWAAGSSGQGARFVSVGLTFQTDHPDWVCGIVDRTIAPRAYAYLVVIGGEGTLAVVLTEARRGLRPRSSVDSSTRRCARDYFGTGALVSRIGPPPRSTSSLAIRIPIPRVSSVTSSFASITMRISSSGTHTLMDT
jgi:hypothetical protein